VLFMSGGIVSPVFVGRDQELSALDAAMAAASGGDPVFAIIGGEAGIGKTRLAEEFATRATTAGFAVLTGNCVELGAEGLPLAPVISALRALTTPIGSGRRSVRCISLSMSRSYQQLKTLAAPAASVPPASVESSRPHVGQPPAASIIAGTVVTSSSSMIRGLVSAT